MKRYFWNEEQNRLRTLWRFLIQLAVWGGMLKVDKSFMLPGTQEVAAGMLVSFLLLTEL